MRAVVQRVKSSSVKVEGIVIASIEQGMLILLGVEEADKQEDIEWLVKKILNLRIFSDEEGKMNRSVVAIQGGILVVSQFTLHASTKKGNRPSFIRAAKPQKAEKDYETFIELLGQNYPGDIQKGSFGAMMDVSLINDGPVTILFDTKNKE
jgi:D-tyrosyl-tRNA(Tyr) deacylase